MSRNQREGRYVGRQRRRAVRSHFFREVSADAVWIELHSRGIEHALLTGASVPMLRSERRADALGITPR